ncbi:MAG: recombination protein RecR [Francisellaceae bacterium]|nr:recombination protein RecR [Francisellaceae bacterium]
MSFSPLINNLINTLRCLPGVGPKSAQRMVFHILERDREGGKLLAESLIEAISKVGHCTKCQNLCEQILCPICENPARDRTKLCVVESPANVAAIEQTASFRGLYFVLKGHLSPLDGIGPEEIGAPIFYERLKEGEVEEVILANSTTVEGETTAFYLAEMLKKLNIKASRIAHGVPLGGDLEYIDANTLTRAISSRRPI